jgi:hypothetical protein
VKFQTPVLGPEGELLRTDTSQLAFPLTALALALPAPVDGSGGGSVADAVAGGGLDLSAMGRTEATMDMSSSSSSSPASEAFGTPAGIDAAAASAAAAAAAGGGGDSYSNESVDTPPTPGTPSMDPPVEDTPARGHMTGLDAGEIELQMEMADEAAEAVKAAQAARLAELEQSSPLPAGWEKDVSRTTGQVYYINSYSGESTYDLPTEPAAPPALSEGMQLMQDAQALAGEDQWAACVETVRRAMVRQCAHRS